MIVGGGPWSPDINFPIHHTARLLARSHRVLYLYRDSHTSLLGHLAGRLPGFHSRIELLRHVAAPRRIEQVDEGLWVMPLSGVSALLPLSYPPIARVANMHLVIRQVRRALRTLHFRDPLLWFYWWFFPEIADAIPHRLAVYDIYDDHSEYDYIRLNRRRQEYTLAQERALLRAVDVVFAVSRSLVRSKSAGAPVHYLPNGVDTRLADTARSAALPSEFAHIPRPIAGYLGSFDSRMSWPLVEDMAQARPDWSFVFVGGGTTAPRAVHPNLYLLGNRPYQEALRYVNGFDLALIPFVRDALTEAICPAKLFDYLALGKPVLSTPLPAVDDIVGDSDMVYRGESLDDFLLLADRALHESADLPERRRELARALTWERRSERAMEIIEEAMRA
ncbi:MAG: glycosyltransferase [Chloroflexota bacterium]